MLYNFQRKKLYSRLLVGGALCVAGLGIFSCSDTYDLDTDQPSGLNSIYGYIEQQGNYSNYLRLIDDLGQTEILSKTGSKTLFIADDDAFARFFQSNKWGVRNYDQLTLAQKKLLLNTAMIDNPYSTSMLSTAAGSASPIKGEVCRRSSSTSLFDSVLVVPQADPKGILPDNDRFANLKANHDSIVLFTDASNAAPMLHFTAKFLSANKLESTDVDFLYNQPAGTRQPDDVYVNNAKIVDANVFCKNGFVHKIDEVILPLDNMAEVIRQNANMSVYSSLLERFAAVSDSTALRSAYNVNKGTSVDSVFIKRYYSDRSAGSTQGRDVAFAQDKDGLTFDASLKFDPGWNAYNSGIAGKGDNAMMEDMGVMLVPSNAAMTDWWNNGGGKVIKDFYGSLEATPNSVIDDLLRVNQLSSFVSSVPSVFADVKNDAQEALGITTDDVDSVFLACNGAIYLTNKVFAPTSYSSVLFPTVVDTTNFNVIENAINNLDYSSYLNSMVAKYIFLLPTNNGLLSYVDPVSYTQAEPQLWEFHFDATKGKNSRVTADVYQCQLNDNGTWEKTGTKVKTITSSMTSTAAGEAGVMKDRFEDMLDNIIVTEGYQAGKKYYRTKGNTFIRIDGINEGSSVYGTWQQERNQPLTVTETYNMENGNSLVLNGVVMGTRNSVAMTLAQHDEFSSFLNILRVCGALSTSNAKDGWQAADQTYGNLFNLKEKGVVGAEDAASRKATYMLNNYHYTVYAPTNAAMEKAFDMGLPTLDDLAAAEEWDELFDDATQGMSDEQKKAYAAEQGTCVGDSTERIQEAMLDFVKYHIQDNSIYVDEGFASGAYESGKTELIASTNIAEEGGYTKVNNNTITVGGQQYTVANWQDGNSVEYYTGKYSPGRPYKLTVNVTGSSLSVNGIDVDTSSGLYNLMAREYWFNSSTSIQNPYSVQINNSSSVVIHAINTPLLYDAPAQFTYTYKPLTTE